MARKLAKETTQTGNITIETEALPKYINRQVIKNACGPIAIVNALLWMGCLDPQERQPRDWLEQLMPWFKQMGFRFSGIDDHFIHAVLARFKVNFTSKLVRSSREIEVLLGKNRSVLLSYYWANMPNRPVRKGSGHLIFIDGHEGQFFNAYNVNGNGAEYKGKLDRYLANIIGKVWCLERSVSKNELDNMHNRIWKQFLKKQHEMRLKGLK